MKVRHAYGVKADPVVNCSLGDPEIEARTLQSKKKDCDVKAIVNRFTKAGLPVKTARGTPRYGDFSLYRGFQESLELVAQAEETFMSLPSELRTRFDNDVSKLVDFVENPANRKEAIELGFLKEREQKAGKTKSAADGANLSTEEAKGTEIKNSGSAGMGS